MAPVGDWCDGVVYTTPHVGREGVDDHAVAVDRHRHHTEPEGGEQGAHRRVARLLDGDRITRSEHRPGDQMDRLLSTGRDHDLARADVDPAERPTHAASAARRSSAPAGSE